MKKLLAFCLLLLPVAIFADPPSQVWTAESVDIRPLLVTPARLKLIAVTQHEENSEKAYLLDLHYPQIMAAPNDSAAQHFNELIKKNIQQQIDTFKNSIASNNPASAKDLPHNINFLKINYVMNGFSSKSQNNEFISIRFTIESYIRGMAHPAQEIQVVNYDLGHDKLLALSDLFKSDVNYLAAISDNVIQQLQARKIPDAMLKQGAAPQADNYKNWNLTMNGLVITFNEAQVAPRYFGKVEVVVPKNVIENMVTRPTACTLGFINCDGT